VTTLLHDAMLLWRDHLQQAWNDNNKTEADKLFCIFDDLLQLSYNTKNSDLISLLQDLKDTARDIVMGARGKSSVPSVDAIKAVFTMPNEAS
jgi:hypothetical protein